MNLKLKPEIAKSLSAEVVASVERAANALARATVTAEVRFVGIAPLCRGLFEPDLQGKPEPEFP